jgi:hypothetical protein
MAAIEDERTAARIGSGDKPALGAAGWLGLAAAPAFAIMALLAGVFGGASSHMGMHHASPLDGMALMYALMCVFHLPPWLRLLAGTRRRSGR